MALIVRSSIWGIGMSLRQTAITVAALSLAALASAGFAKADDLPVKAEKKSADLPFFLLNDNRLTYSYIFSGTDPSAWTRTANGSIDGKTAKQVYSFTHFDIWAYGANFFNISMFKSGHNDPASPCVTNDGIVVNVTTNLPASCAGATEIYGLFRSTFGWNEIFGTKAFTMGPLRNISFEVGMDANTENNFVAPAKRDVVAGLQFQFDLPYKGFFNVAPLMYWEFSNHDSFAQCGLFGPGIAGVTCLVNGNTHFNPNLGGRDQLLYGPRLLAGEYPVFLDQRSRRPVRQQGNGEQSSALHGARQHQYRGRVQLGADPSHLRCLQGDLG
jgi:hypothetical protein